jgi:hypothetical protein
MGGSSLVGIIMPDAWTAADLSFQVSMDGVRWVSLYDAYGGRINLVTPGVSRYITLSPSDFAGPRHIRVVSGSPAMPVVQAAARDVVLVGRAL